MEKAERGWQWVAIKYIAAIITVEKAGTRMSLRGAEEEKCKQNTGITQEIKPSSESNSGKCEMLAKRAGTGSFSANVSTLTPPPAPQAPSEPHFALQWDG